MTRVLFICTHNSARSQIAEALLRQLTHGEVEAVSAGTHPGRVHPLAVAAMTEVEIDISGQSSKGLERYTGQHLDYVITVCDQAKESCLVFPGAKRQLHWSLPDPSAVEGSDEIRLAAFREVRDELRELIKEFLSGAENDTSHLRTPAKRDPGRHAGHGRHGRGRH